MTKEEINIIKPLMRNLFEDNNTFSRYKSGKLDIVVYCEMFNKEEKEIKPSDSIFEKALYIASKQKRIIPLLCKFTNFKDIEEMINYEGSKFIGMDECFPRIKIPFEWYESYKKNYNKNQNKK